MPRACENGLHASHAFAPKCPFEAQTGTQLRILDADQIKEQRYNGCYWLLCFDWRRLRINGHDSEREHMKMCSRFLQPHGCNCTSIARHFVGLPELGQGCKKAEGKDMAESSADRSPSCSFRIHSRVALSQKTPHLTSQ